VALLYQGDLCKFFADFQGFEKSFEIFSRDFVFALTVIRV
jgi:hypothetical protein